MRDRPRYHSLRPARGIGHSSSGLARYLSSSRFHGLREGRIQLLAAYSVMLSLCVLVPLAILTTAVYTVSRVLGASEELSVNVVNCLLKHYNAFACIGMSKPLLITASLRTTPTMAMQQRYIQAMVTWEKHQMTSKLLALARVVS